MNPQQDPGASREAKPTFEPFKIDERSWDEVYEAIRTRANSPQLERAEAEIVKLKARIQGLEATKRSSDQDALESLEATRGILCRISPAVHHQVPAEKLQSEFVSRECEAFVMSVDIRGSTELMLSSLAAQKPEGFAKFILELCKALREIVMHHNGIFDKFTGDGILAFFPPFYSGEDAGYHALSAAVDCHDFYHKHFSENKAIFQIVPEEAGLGIGIDFGRTHLVFIGGEPTVVGAPVVFACRMGSAPAKTTFVNNQAYQKTRRYEDFEFKEDYLTLKHQDRRSETHCVTRRDRLFSAARPAWESWCKPGGS